MFKGTIKNKLFDFYNQYRLFNLKIKNIRLLNTRDSFSKILSFSSAYEF